MTKKQMGKYAFKVLNKDTGTLTINNVLVCLLLFEKVFAPEKKQTF